MQILSPSTIKLWPGHRIWRKIINKGSEIGTGPLYSGADRGGGGAKGAIAPPEIFLENESF